MEEEKMYRRMTRREDIFNRKCAIESGDSEDLRIVLLGVSGAGKSSIGNAILGRDVFKERRTRESETQRGRVEDRNISIIDTPGFFNPHLTDEEMKKQMMKSLDLSDPGPHVFLLVINLEDFKEDERNIVEQIRKNFGAQAFRFILVLFTGREKMTNREWNLFMDSRNFQAIVSHCRDKYHSINSKSEISLTHITKLLKKIDEIIKQNDGQLYKNGIYSVSQTKSGKEKRKQERKKDRKKEQKNEMRQEKIKIEQETFEMGSVMAERTEKESLISCVRESERNHVFEENEKAGKTQRKWGQNKQQTTGKQHLVKAVMADLRIVMVGKTGAGKSATGNTILRQKLFKEDFSTKSVTEKCQQHQQKVEGQIISVIDTPGLYDTSISEEELKEELVKCVEMSVPGPHAFLLVIRLDVRFTDEEKNTVKWIQKNFGEEAAHYTIILFTRGDQLDTTIEDFLIENTQINDLVKQCKGGYHVFNNKDEQNQSQATELIEKIDRMVKENGGEHYTNEMFKKAQMKIMLRKAALVGVGVAGVGAAAAAGGALICVTGGVAVPAALMAGRAVLTVGTVGKAIVDRVKK